MDKKLTTHEQIRKYVISTILTGDKTRIKLVLKRYQDWLKEQDSSAYSAAKDIFGLKDGG